MDTFALAVKHGQSRGLQRARGQSGDRDRPLSIMSIGMGIFWNLALRAEVTIVPAEDG